jgi:membrane-associated phospholipid phosphatase
MSELVVRLLNSGCGRWALLDGLMHALDSGRPYFACLAVVLLLPLALTRGRARRCWLAGLLAVLLAVVSATLAGRLLAGALPRQPRPLQVLDLRLPFAGQGRQDQESLLRGRPDTSIPSTHAITGGAVGLSLLWWRPVLGVLVALLGCLLMITPVLYFGLHWPGDVGVSLAIAAVAGWGSACCRARLAGAARMLDLLLHRRPVSSLLALVLISSLAIWRVHPGSGLMDALTSAVRSLLSIWG